MIVLLVTGRQFIKLVFPSVMLKIGTGGLPIYGEREAEVKKIQLSNVSPKISTEAHARVDSGTYLD